nr:NADH-plastoquinone oxidoreductase subunit 4 [Pueraria montana var. lobata]UZA65144.1 NADH-plastoquinone oxidoreductase subunit 4 [Pueraria montana var. thomsonii]UZA65313.1 NADH-plastoquinone oxidoreductase subunit 4 [Pueraria montana]
MVYYLYMFN